MKKISKKDLQGLRRQFPVLSKDEMRRYVGGYGNGYDGWGDFGGTGYGWGNNDGDFGGSGGYWGNGYSDNYYDNAFNDWLASGNYFYDENGNFFWYSEGSGPDYFTQNQYDTMANNGTWPGGYVEGMGFVTKETEIIGDYPTTPGSNGVWVNRLLNALCYANTDTINLPQVMGGGLEYGGWYPTSLSNQTITISGVTFTGLYVGVTPSDAHQIMDSKYTWSKPVYGAGGKLVKTVYIFDVQGTDLDMEIAVPVDQMEDFERIFGRN